MIHIVSFVIENLSASTIALTNVAAAAIGFCVGVVTGLFCVCAAESFSVVFQESKGLHPNILS